MSCGQHFYVLWTTQCLLFSTGHVMTSTGRSPQDMSYFSTKFVRILLECLVGDILWTTQHQLFSTGHGMSSTGRSPQDILLECLVGDVLWTTQHQLFSTRHVMSSTGRSPQDITPISHKIC